MCLATAAMAVIEGTVDTAMTIVTLSLQAKTVRNALRSKGRVINIDPLDIGF